MMSLSRVISELLEVLNDLDVQRGLKRSVVNASAKVFKLLRRYPYLNDLAERVRKVKEEVFKNMDYYLNLTIKNVERTGGMAYLAKEKGEALKIIGEIVGKGKLIVKSKSMVTEELGLREYLTGLGNIVFETDLGELLIQITGEKPMHPVAPAIHMTKEKAAEVLRRIGLNVDEKSSPEHLVAEVRRFLREKFIKAEVGISGGNSIAADTGSIVLVSNEGNIRNTTNLPEVHIAIVSIEKIMPTYQDAVLQAIVQSAYAGLYPPTYLSVISGPSSTADIEQYRVYGVHGPKEVHVILYDGGRVRALEHPYLKEQLYCIKCGRCQIECPVWEFTGNVWGGKVYGGPMGINWTAIIEGIEEASKLAPFCLGCKRCDEVCPVRIKISDIIRQLKKYAY